MNYLSDSPREWRIKKRDLFIKGKESYRCPHCDIILFQNKTSHNIYWDDTIQRVVDICSNVNTSTQGDLYTTKIEDNRTECIRCRKPAFSNGLSFGKSKIITSRYELDDELFEI